MNELAVRKLQRRVTWSGPLGTLLFFAGWIVLSHNFPPPDPTFSAQELVTNYYVRYRSGIMLGMSLAACFGMFYLPWTCIISVVMMQRERYPLLSLMQLSGGLLTAWILVMGPCIWVYCAEAATSVQPDIIKSLHFVAWYIFNMTWMITTIQCVAVGIFALMDDQAPEIFPRWFGWLSIGIGLSFAPLTFLPFFKTGPMALNGWYAFYYIVLSFGAFELNTTRFVLRKLNRDIAELERPGALAPSGVPSPQPG